MSSERLLEIDAVMQRHIDSGEIQGAVTMVARRGKVVHFKAHGLMDVERGRAMQEDAIFRMASSSKPVLGVAAMMLIEEGLLHPSDEVATYLPQFKDMHFFLPPAKESRRVVIHGLGAAMSPPPAGSPAPPETSFASSRCWPTAARCSEAPPQPRVGRDHVQQSGR